MVKDLRIPATPEQLAQALLKTPKGAVRGPAGLRV